MTIALSSSTKTTVISLGGWNDNLYMIQGQQFSDSQQKPKTTSDAAMKKTISEFVAASTTIRSKR